MKNTDEPIKDFTEEEWESMRRDHALLETFQASPLHIKAKARLRDILSCSTRSEEGQTAPEKNFPEG
jgi:hypothetical protein